jgi:hypothetical protein
MPSNTSGRSSVGISSISAGSWDRSYHAAESLSGISITNTALRALSGDTIPEQTIYNTTTTAPRHDTFLYIEEDQPVPRSSLEYQSLVNINDLQQRVKGLEEKVAEMAIQERDKLALCFIGKVPEGLNAFDTLIKAYEMADAMLEARKWE